MRFFSPRAFLLAATISLLPGWVLAQAPANDRCATATQVNSGQFLLGVTTGANDDVSGLAGCQAGTPTTVHPDVWFSLVAVGSRLKYTITPDVATPNLPWELVFFEGACGTPTIVGTACNAGTITDSIGGLIAGRTYRIMLASPSVAQTGSFVVSFTSSVPTVTPAQDCRLANILSTSAPIVQGGLNLGAGTDPNEVDPDNSCWGSGGERQPKWYKFVAGASGKLQFNINPVDPNTDYDWGVWDITGDPTGCTTKGDAIACNWTGARGATGLSLCEDSEPGFQGGDQFDNKTTGQTGANAPIDVVAGNIYALLVDNFTTNSTGFTLTFGGPPGGCPGGTGTTPLTSIGLDAQFDYVKVSCGVVNFTKRNPVNSGVNVTYLWSFGDGTTSNLQNPTHTYNFVTDSTVFVTLRVVDILGNPYSIGQSIRIAPPSPVVARSIPGDLCVGDSVTLTATGADLFEWSGPGVTAGFSGAALQVAPTVTTTYQLIATRDLCVDTSYYDVVVTALPTTLATVAQPSICSGNSTTLTVTGADRYEWSPALGLSSTTDSTVTATPTVTTTYIVTGYNGTAQCAVVDSVTVVVTPAAVTVATVALPSICAGGSTTLSVTGADSYEWSPATGLSSTTDSVVTASPTETTTYIVRGTNNGQCSVEDTITVVVTPTAAATGDISVTEGASPLTTVLTSTVADATAWLWDFGDGTTSTEQNPTHTYTADGLYSVTLTATYGVAGCQTPVTKIGEVNAQMPIVYNIITPNGDGKNDTFLAPVSSQPMKVQIFNRWGREVYSVENYQQNWNGDDLPAGTYYYHISIASGKTWKGWVELVR